MTWFGHRAHHQVRAIQLGTRSAVRVICLCDRDVVERIHERSERRYGCRHQRPCQPYLDPNRWRYEGEAFVFRINSPRKPPEVRDGETDNTGSS